VKTSKHNDIQQAEQEMALNSGSTPMLQMIKAYRQQRLFLTVDGSLHGSHMARMALTLEYLRSGTAQVD